MASAVISSILKATSDWLSLIRSTPTTSSTSTSVADDLERLERMLERIKAVLQDAEEREIVDKSVKLWLKEIKDVAYDAEDLLDEYQYHVLQALVESRVIKEGAAAAEASSKMKYVDGEEEVMPLASSSFASNLAASKISILSSMADRIKKIRKRFKEISIDRDRLQLKPEDGKRRHDSNSEYPPPTTHMVKEQETYGREVDRENLINWLFSKEESKFEVVAVVGKGGLGKTTLAQLIFNDQKVEDYFQKRTWICVSEDFNLVRLTRTMIESITEKSCTLSELSLLQETLQKELKGKRVLLVLDDVWSERKDLWESLSIPFYDAEIMRIVVTTRNIPVAEVMQTTTDPYHLDYLPEEQSWNLFVHHAFSRRDPNQFPSLVHVGKKIVKKCDGLPLAVKSLGGLLQHEEDEDTWNDILHSRLWENETNILPALLLSYIRMPSHLKPCFEICSIFPKDYEFNKDELVELWAAHGYIQHNGEKINAAKKIGNMYVNELHRRSFFDKYYGRFKMHDNIHDLAHYVQVGTDLNNHYKHKIRHFSIRENESFEFYLNDIGALRTLIVVQRNIRVLTEMFKSTIIFMENGTFKLRLNNIGSQRTLIAALENTITIKYMLERNIRRLTRLRYLHIELYTTNQPELFLEGIGNLICLRHLKLGVGAKMKLPKSIGDLYNLVALEINSYELVELPETFKNLVYLTTIRFSYFQNDQLPALGQLPSLRSLTISDFPKVKSIGNELCRGCGNNHSHVAFPSLTSLVLHQLPILQLWDDLQEGDFPRLQNLKISMCCSLSRLPSLQNLGLLSHMSLRECDSLPISPEALLPPNLKTLVNFGRSKLSLPQGFGELKKLERLSGIFGVRTNKLFGILKNLVNPKYLILSEIWNAHSAWNDETCLTEYTLQQ